MHEPGHDTRLADPGRSHHGDPVSILLQEQITGLGRLQSPRTGLGSSFAWRRCVHDSNDPSDGRNISQELNNLTDQAVVIASGRS